jgi:hypothetical protein
VRVPPAGDGLGVGAAADRPRLHCGVGGGPGLEGSLHARRTCRLCCFVSTTLRSVSVCISSFFLYTKLLGCSFKVHVRFFLFTYEMAHKNVGTDDTFTNLQTSDEILNSRLGQS